MDAVTRQADRGGKHDLPGNHSHVVRPAEMEWKKTRFPGCEVKGLLLSIQADRPRDRTHAARARRGSS
jgi:hypothetical protein